jgi:FMN reductase
MPIKRPKLVSLSGSPRSPSKTDVLVSTLSSAITQRTSAESKSFTLSEIAPAVLPALTRENLSPEGEAVIATIEAADIVVVGTPVYRASFTGILKHVLDLVRYDALIGRIGVLAATGGSPLHGLVVEHQLRPLLSFFGTHTAPTGVYATDADFTDYKITNSAITKRIDSAANEVQRLLTGWSASPEPSALIRGDGR